MTPLQEYEKFREYNLQHRIVEGVWLDAQGRPANGLPETGEKLRYRFENNAEIVLSLSAVEIIRAKGFVTRWKY